MEFMDQETREALDFQYVLNKINTLTPYGNMFKRRLRAFKLGEEDKLIGELNKIEDLLNIGKNKEIMEELKGILSHIKDLRTSIRRGMEGFILTEVELFEIKNFLYLIRDLSNIVEKYGITIFEDTEIKPVEQLERLLDPEDTGISTFYIYDAYSEELKGIRKKKQNLEKEIKLGKKHIKEKIKEELNISLRPDSSAVVSKDDKELIDKLQDYPYLSYVSETYMTVKFAIKPTEGLKALENQVNILKDKEEREELRIRERLSKEIGKRNRQIYKNMGSIGRLDLLLSKVRFAIEIRGVKPEIICKRVIKIEDGIHPKVKEVLEGKNLKFTPISLELREGVTCITGANMGGKTISLKLIGLLSAMAQHGLFVPAKSMVYGLNKFIVTSIGDMQSTDSGLSTFGGEIKTVQNAIKMSEDKGLILIDELARGTNPEEGYAISKAIVSHLKEKSSISLLTTHYDNVANSEEVLHLQVVGLSKLDFNSLAHEISKGDKMEIINKYMDYRLRIVQKDTPIPKDAINIARIMGLEPGIIAEAEKELQIKY
ncbi:MAG: DNA mismatch repair protein MutS [Tissierellaceae bacterium]